MADSGDERLRGEASDLLQLAVEIDGDHARIAPSGEIDRATVPKLATTLEQTTHDPGVRRVTVDLNGVAFLDASALYLLCSTASEARRDGFDFEVTRPSRHIRRLFVLTGVDRLLRVIER